MLKNFGLKFVDIMLGVILGLGFQWWPQLHETWQYIAFIFVYLNLIDYWIDYSPAVRQYPFKNQYDVVLHTFIIFSMFFIIYSTLSTIFWFFLAWVFYRLADFLWLWTMKREYRPSAADLKYINTWILSDTAEALLALFLFYIYFSLTVEPLVLLIIFIVLRLLSRVLSSVRYKKFFYEG